MAVFKQRLHALREPARSRHLGGIRRGVEKESLRVAPDGKLALTPHPAGLGSPLTHPHITTDFSEALLELITEPFQRVEELLEQLDQIHRYTYAQLPAGERLWPASMPCALGKDDEIPVALYGDSNGGLMKTVYRRGLSHRYGRRMQTIAGNHYNFSLPDDFWRDLQRQEGGEKGAEESLQDFKTRRYFDLIRNFRRNSWLLIYLFGASPAVCRSFVRGREHQLTPFNGDEHTLHSPYATSLRMGDLGYQSDAQQQLIVCYNDLASYMQTLCEAITRPHPAYREAGVRDDQGQYQQLNTGLLQIENEFYSNVRPKRTARPGETALQALRLRGVEYIEVRCLDLDPEHPLGIGTEQIHFLDAFLLYCLLEDSPRTDNREYRHLQENQTRIVYRGRDPSLRLLRGEEELSREEWGAPLLDKVAECAELLDESLGGQAHSQAVAAQRARLADPERTPSARVLAQMRASGQSFFQHTLAQAESHREHFAARPLAAATLADFEQLAERSRQQQDEIDAQPQPSFEEHLARYYAQYRCCQQ